ncbi:MAG: 50S ribosomal protein L5 [Acidobacteria bacterium]|nr:50S ribosomal protein L5 [Acidobacteriota bacterium]
MAAKEKENQEGQVAKGTPASKEGKAAKEPKAPKPPKDAAAAKDAKGAKESKAAPEAAAAKPPKAPRPLSAPPSRLFERYKKEIAPALAKEFSIGNPMAVPRLRKIVVNMGMGEATQNIKLLDAASAELGQISGQKPVVHRARKSIAQFKVRQGMPIGCSVTLRGQRMYEFLDRLTSIALPRVRDFRGLPSKAFDGRGNYTLGIRDQLIFPEIDYAKVDKARGMNITLVTDAKTDEEARSLLRHLGIPFRT